MQEIVLRPVTLDDAAMIHAIYSASVLRETASWEYAPPDVDEMRRRLQAILDHSYPYFVAVDGAQVVGYTYAGPYRPRIGYRFTVENSIYVDPAYQRRGIARRLMTHLIDACTDRGFRQMIAVIGDSQNVASIALHCQLGFTRVGLLPNIGFKFDRWLDGVLMQRTLGDGHATRPTA
ncbi:MAG: N-acetyltransferase family protein [Caldilineaceae bacterium]